MPTEIACPVCGRSFPVRGGGLVSMRVPPHTVGDGSGTPCAGSGAASGA